jgi:large subunit ribosomal protein L3
MRPWPDHGQGRRPGSKGGWVTIKDAVKKPLPNGLPLPAAIKMQPPLKAEAPAEAKLKALAEEAPREAEE